MAGVKKDQRLSSEERKAKKKAYMAKYRAENKEKIAAQKALYDAEYRKNNKEKLRKHRAEYYAEHRQEAIAQSVAWQKENKERYRARLSRYYLKNRERLLGYQVTYSQANKEKIAERKKSWINARHELIRIYSHNRRARVRANGGTLSNDLAERLYRKQKGRCRACGKPLGKDYHIDHIKPIVRGGLNTDSNCQLLHKRCNLSKGKKDPFEYAQLLGRLFI